LGGRTSALGSISTTSVGPLSAYQPQTATDPGGPLSLRASVSAAFWSFDKQDLFVGWQGALRRNAVHHRRGNASGGVTFALTSFPRTDSGDM
jgi:hypothetical protein